MQEAPLQLVKITRDASGSGHENDVVALFEQLFVETVGFPEPTPGPVAQDGVAQLGSGGDAEAVFPQAVAAAVDHDKAANSGITLGIESSEHMVQFQRNCEFHAKPPPVGWCLIIRLRGEQMVHPFTPNDYGNEYGLPDRSLVVGRADAARRHPILRLRGDDGSALCTAAGKDLTAVGGSHSLSETVDFGSVTLSGLIGTQHGVHLL